MDMTDSLGVANEYLWNEVAPRANAIDGDPEALREALDGLCKRNLMALRRPVQFGGPALSESDFRTFQETVARVSGSLAFLQTQHQSAVSMISKGDNEELKARALPEMADGTRLMGIGFSQLRRPGPPMLRAQRAEGGYLLNGSVPWVTGLGFYHQFLIGASLADGTALFGVVPFVHCEGLDFSEPMKLTAMESPQTVSAELRDFFLADTEVSSHKPAGWIHENDLINITIQGFFAVGCARAGLDIVERAYQKRETAFLKSAHEQLLSELESCRAEMVRSLETSSEDVTTDQKLKVRAWAIDLAVRCAHAGVAATGGAANSVDHSAQRVFREALVYTVSAQTTPIMQATLERLCSRGG